MIKKCYVVLFIMGTILFSGCRYTLPELPEIITAGTGESNMVIHIRDGSRSDRGVSSTVYDVDSLLIDITGEQSMSITWVPGAETEILLSLPEGMYLLKLTHFYTDDQGKEEQCTEYLSFSLGTMKITAITIIPGCVGVMKIQDGITGWPVFLHDRKHSGRSIYNGPDSLNVLWTYDLGGRIVSSPVVGNDRIYIGCENGLVCFDSEGNLQWVFDTADAAVNSAPAIGENGTIYCGTPDGMVYAVNPDGSERWVFDTGSEIYSALVLDSDGDIYLGAYNGLLYGFDPEGNLIGSYQTAGVIHSTPVLDSAGVIYCASSSANHVYAVNPDFTLKWQSDTFGNAIGSSPALSNNEKWLYVGCDDGYLYSLDCVDGSVRWQIYSYGGIQSSPVVGNDETVYAGTQYGNLWAIDPLDGSLLWDYYMTLSVFGSPVIDNRNIIYWCTTYGRIFAINPDGTLYWQDGPEGADHFYSSPALGSNRVLYVGNDNGLLYAIK